jgi:hypothetical protein
MTASRIDFLCLGAQKAGTTSLRAYLRLHPQLDLPEHELHIFDRDDLDWHDSSAAALQAYIPFPDPSAEARDQRLVQSSELILRGEVTPIYLYWKPCPLRVHRYNPAIKMIVLLRNPVARAYSHWSMELNRGAEKLSFSDAIRAESLRLAIWPEAQHRVVSYLDRGRYHEQLMRFLALFGRHQLLVLQSEQFYGSPEASLRAITDFLGVEPWSEFGFKHERQGDYSSSLSLADWEFTYAALADDIERLEHLLGWDCSAWKQPWPGLV